MLDAVAGQLDDSQAVARRLVPGFAARAGAHDRDGSFPHDNVAELRRAGLLGLTGSVAVGGADAGLLEVCAVVGTIAEGCAATSLVMAMHLIQLRAARFGRWPAATLDLLERSAVQGGLVNALRVEPALGTPARGGMPATLARRVAAGWSIDGHKATATGAPGLTWLLVWARTDETPARTGAFLVPAGAPGVRVVETWDQMGLRASGSHDVLLEGVVVPADHALDLRAQWWPPDATAWAWSTLVIAALYTGVARAARDWLVRFLHDRAPSNLGAPLATLPRLQEALGEIEGALAANARIIDSAARACDAGSPPTVAEAGLLKTVAAEAAIRAVQRAVEVAGNPGLSRAHPLERHLRDVLCARIHTPQPDSAYLAAGRAALGL